VITLCHMYRQDKTINTRKIKKTLSLKVLFLFVLGPVTFVLLLLNVFAPVAIISTEDSAFPPPRAWRFWLVDFFLSPPAKKLWAWW